MDGLANTPCERQLQRNCPTNPKRDNKTSHRALRGVWNFWDLPWNKTLALLIILLIFQVIQQAFVLCSPEI